MCTVLLHVDHCMGVHHCTGVYTIVRGCTPLYGCVHYCSGVYTIVRVCTLLFGGVHRCTGVYTIVRGCTPLYGCVHAWPVVILQVDLPAARRTQSYCGSAAREAGES